MNIYGIVLFIVIAAFLIGGISLRRYGKQLDDYYLMGRNAPGWMVGFSTMASWGTLWAWIGAIGYAWQNGPLTPMLFYGSSWGMLLLCVLLARLLRKGEYRTLSTFFRERYSNRVSAIAALVLAIGTVFYLFPQFTGAGSLVLSALGIPYFWAITIFAIFVLVFVIFGGMASAIAFGAFMFIIMIASAVGYPFGIAQATNIPLSEVVSSTAKAIGNQYWSSLGFTGQSVGYWVAQVGSWIAIASVSGHIISMSLAAKNERELDKGFGLAFPLNGAVLATLYVFTGALALIIPRGSIGVDFFAAHVYINVLPTWLGVILVTGCVAAALSSVAAMFVTIATNLVNDFVGKYLKPGLPDDVILKWTKVVIVIVGFLCIPLGYYMPGGLIVVATGFMGAFLLSCIFFPLAIGAYWGRVTEKAVYIHILINLPLCFFMVVTNMALGWFAPSPLLWLMPISFIIFFGLVYALNPTAQDKEKWVAFYKKVHVPVPAEEVKVLTTSQKIKDALPVIISMAISIVMLIVYLVLVVGGSA